MKLYISLFIITLQVTALLDESECGKSVTCFKNPINCGLSDTNCRILSWKKNNDNFDFTISANIADNQWAGFAFSSGQTMTSKGDLYVCAVANGVPAFKSQYFETQSRPIDVAKSATITASASSYNNGLLTCEFSRPESVTVANTVFDLQNNLFILSAIGPFANGQLNFHSSRSATSETNDFQTGVISTGSTKKPNGKLLSTHVVLMALAWLLFAPIAIWTAGTMKCVDKKLFGTDIWFTIHRAFMVATVIFTIIGILTVFSFKDWKWIEKKDSYNANRHAIFGITTMVIAIINPIMAFFRPGKEAKHRKIFNFAHGILGRAARILSFIAVIYILSYLSPKGYAYGAKIMIIIIAVLEFCFGVALMFIRWKHLNKILYITYVVLVVVGCALVLNAYFQSALVASF